MDVPLLPRLLSPDLCLEIFARLDAKSLAASKSVSRNWLRFLSHPAFAKFYSRRRPAMTGFFYSSSVCYRVKLRYVSVGDEHEPVIQPSSCLGFLESPAILYDSAGGLLHWATSWDDRFISNPLTRKFVRLDWPFHIIEFFACGIAFDPSVSTHFEIVVLVKKPNLNLEPSVLSLETMEWTKCDEIEVCSSSLVPYERNRGIFLEGSLYWETTDNRILGYEVTTRSARIIELPQRLNPNNNQERGCLGWSSGRLYYGRIEDRTLEVWVYSDCINRWEVKQSINFDKFDRPQVLAFVEGCEGVWLSMAKKIVHWCFSGAIKNAFEMQRAGSVNIQPSMFFPFVHSLAFCERL